MKRITGYHIIASLIIFLGFMIFVLPNEARKSESLGLDQGPDTSIFYTSEELYDMAESYGTEGRRFYIEQRFTFDLIWPIAYGLFLIWSLSYVGRTSRTPWIKKAYLLPVVAVVFDYLENVMTATVMYRYPETTFLLGYLAGPTTFLKWITLTVSMVLLFIMFTYWMIKKVRGGSIHE